MEKHKIIQGKDIEKLVTKFYYKNRQLYFQIILNLGLDGRISYSEYDDYFVYKQKFNELLDAKHQDKNVLVPDA